MDKHLAKEVRKGQFEVADDGLYLPKSQIFLRGVFEHDVRRNGEMLGKMVDSNLIVDEGMDYILNVAYRGNGVEAQISPWYLGIYEGTYTPLGTETAADIHTLSSESISYNPSSRPEWVEGTVTGQALTNSESAGGTRATFTMTAGVTIRGAFLISNPTRNGGIGTLSSAAEFGTPRALLLSDELILTYSIQASSS